MKRKKREKKNLKNKKYYHLRKKVRKKSEENSDIIDISYIDKNELLKINENEKNEILIKGYLIYRTTFNQIEIIGNWIYDNKEQPVSYLLNKQNNNLAYKLLKYEIKNSNYNFNINKNIQGDYFYLNIGNKNITQILIIDNDNIHQIITPFFSGQYIGYYINNDRTIEEEFFLSFLNDDYFNQIKIIGYGHNDNGDFNINGNIHFYKDKIEMITKNRNQPYNTNNIYSPNYGAIYLGEIKMNKIQKIN